MNQFKREQAIARQLAAYIYNEATRESRSGNYVITFDDIESHYNIPKGALINNLGLRNDIIEELYAYEGVAEVERVNETFDLNLYTDYLLNYEEDKIEE